MTTRRASQASDATRSPVVQAFVHAVQGLVRDRGALQVVLDNSRDILEPEARDAIDAINSTLVTAKGKRKPAANADGPAGSKKARIAEPEAEAIEENPGNETNEVGGHAGTDLSRWEREVVSPVLNLDTLPPAQYFEELVRTGKSKDPLVLFGDVPADDLDYATEVQRLRSADGAFTLAYMHARAMDQRYDQASVHTLYSKLAVYDLARDRQRAAGQRGGRLTTAVEKKLLEDLQRVVCALQVQSDDPEVEAQVGLCVREDYHVGKRLRANFVDNFGPGSLFYIASIPGLSAIDRIARMPMRGKALDKLIQQLDRLGLAEKAERSGANALGHGFRMLYKLKK